MLHLSESLSSKKKKKQKIVSDGEDVEKLEPLYTVGGNIEWFWHDWKQYGGSSSN